MSSDGAISDLRDWLLKEAGGCLAPGVVVDASDLGGHGIFLGINSDPLTCGSEVFSLPLASCLSSEDTSVVSLQVSALYRVIELLCAELQKNEGSWWTPYFAMLPQKTGSWPEWRDAEMSLVEKGPPHFSEPVAKLMRGLPALYRAVSKDIPGGVVASLDDKAPFRRAMSIITSRKFGFYSAENSKMTACIPFGDMLNHSFTPNVTVQYDQSTNDFRFLTTRDINPGEELLQCYGRHDNITLCTQFGFIVPGNPYDEVSFDDALAETDEKDQALKRLLEGLPLPIEDETVLVAQRSSVGCYAIARWRLAYREHLENKLCSHN